MAPTLDRKDTPIGASTLELSCTMVVYSAMTDVVRTDRYYVAPLYKNVTILFLVDDWSSCLRLDRIYKSISSVINVSCALSALDSIRVCPVDV